LSQDYPHRTSCARTSVIFGALSFNATPKLLKLSDTLGGMPEVRDIRISYAKYEAFIDACRKVTKLTSEGRFPRRPSNDDIIEVFFAKSTYFKYHAKIFPLVKKVPIVEQWLRSEDGVSDDDVWGDAKPNFENLKKILDEHLAKDVKSVEVKKKGKEVKKVKEVKEVKKRVERDRKGKKKEKEDDPGMKKASSSKNV
jgi:hypothetical protein